METIANNTTIVESGIIDDILRQSWAMLAVGFVPLLTSIVILHGLHNIPQKRKESIFFTALCVSTLIVGFGYVSAGIRRWYVLAHGGYMSTQLHCLLVGVHNFFFEIGETTSAFVMFFLTTDQLAAMVTFRWYLKLTSRRAVQLICLVYTLSTVAYLLVVFVTIINGRHSVMISALCYQDESFPSEFYNLHFCFLLIAYHASLIECLIALSCRYGRKKTHSTVARLIQMIREKKATQRVSVIIFFRSVFQMLPMTWILFVPDGTYEEYVWLSHPLGLSLELTLYALLDREIRNSYKCPTILTDPNGPFSCLPFVKKTNVRDVE
ncbi:hypothetical protein Tsp_08117 [Trichinella spiralis]|nr:hypothetical protein Tsp_08117 [Trichinella spiralis]